jgi:transcriptional regulator with PAS, ATPase and Fis domain
MTGILVSGHSGPLSPEENGSIQAIADALAGAGLRMVRLDEMEWAAIRNALDNHGGNRTRAAKALGISVRTIQRKLKSADDAEPSRDALRTVAD